MKKNKIAYTEQAARRDLVAALRSAERLGLAEGVCNHFSLAVPGKAEQFLINPQGLHWSEVTPADLVVVDGDGRQLSGKHTVEPTAFFIHGRIHRAHPRALRAAHAYAVCDDAHDHRGRPTRMGEPECVALPRPRRV